MKFYEIPGTLSDEIVSLEKSIEEYKSGNISPVQFKAIRVPFGVYEQRKNNTYMVRIRCTAGGITPTQLARVAELSQKFGSSTIHVTTRQEAQIHDVLIDDLISVLKGLLSVGLSSRGGGGNTIRNITVSVDSGISTEEIFDVEPYAIALTTKLISESDSWLMPRKFKIAFSSTWNDSAHATVHDLGFIAMQRNARKGFQVFAAGGMGAKPMYGQLLHDFIEADQVYVVAEALKKIFDKHGNRKNRHAARLRFLWKKLGRDEFIRLYNGELKELDNAENPSMTVTEIDNQGIDPYLDPIVPDTKDYAIWKNRYVTLQKQDGLRSIKMPLMLGDISSVNAIRLAKFLEPFGDNVLRFSIDQNLHIRNIPDKYLGNFYIKLSELSSLSSQPVILSNIITCAGAGTCKLGICMPRGAVLELYDIIQKSDTDFDSLKEFKINISGCPNSCGQHHIGDLGFYGKVGRKDGRLYPAYNVMAGAIVEAGNTRFSERLSAVNARDLPDVIQDILKGYILKKGKFNKFSLYFDNGGKNEIKIICNRYGGIPAFEKDKNYYFDWGDNHIFSIAGSGKGECSAGLFDMINFDVELIKDNRNISETSIDEKEIQNALYNIVLLSSRMLLITKGIEASSNNDIFDQFIKAFIKTKIVSNRFNDIIFAARVNDYGSLVQRRSEVYEMAEVIINLYDGMDDSLRFPDEQREEQKGSFRHEDTERNECSDKFKDYRGVKCPLNYVKTKLNLEMMSVGETLQILLDDGEAMENVPRSVEEDGHRILEQNKISDYWSVIIKKV